MKFYFLLLLLLTMCSQPQPTGFMECPCKYTNPKNLLYNQVLTELIEKSFYRRYLPDSSEANIQHALNKQFPQRHFDDLDEAALKRHQAALKKLEGVQQRLLFNDSTRFKTIYLDTISPESFAYSVKSFTNDKLNLQDNDSLKSLVVQFGTIATPTMMTTLTRLQQHLTPADFQLCTARIALRSAKNQRSHSDQIGVVRFSELVFNDTHTKALLSYDWTCGGNCGFAEVLLVVKVKDKWQIQQHAMLWIS